MKPPKSILLLAVCFLSNSAKADCDFDAGKKQFNKCVACHSVEPGALMTGPSLHGLFGRKVGSLEGFAFSPAMEASRIVWTEETLSAFLQEPMTYIPGTVMPFGGVRKAEQRDSLICYLKQVAESSQQK
jgi:cytochrome c